MLDSESDTNVGSADTRQGVGRTVTVAVEASKGNAKNKCKMLQKFFVRCVLKDWLREQKPPMVATSTDDASRWAVRAIAEGRPGIGSATTQTTSGDCDAGERFDSAPWSSSLLLAAPEPAQGQRSSGIAPGGAATAIATDQSLWRCTPRFRISRKRNRFSSS